MPLTIVCPNGVERKFSSAEWEMIVYTLRKKLQMTIDWDYDRCDIAKSIYYIDKLRELG